MTTPFDTLAQAVALIELELSFALRAGNTFLAVTGFRMISDIYIDGRMLNTLLSTLTNEAINNVYSAGYGGDDGARTRDLCRDRAEFRYNSLKLMSTVG